MTAPLVAVVVVNYNGAADSAACLASLAAASPGPGAVVVVDNASQPDDVAALLKAAHARAPALAVLRDASARSESPWLVLALDTNLGFAAGCNAGIAAVAERADITHFLLLNNDATVTPDYFARLADALERAPDVAVLSGTVLEADAPHGVWYAGGEAHAWRALMLHRYAVPASAEPLDTPFVSGCTMLISRAAFAALGPLPECYFPGYWEDAEYSTRARAAGLRVLYAPAVVAYHRGGATFGLPSRVPRVAYLQNRHRALYVRRNMRGVARLVALAYLLVTKPGRCVFDALLGRPQRGWAVLRGLIDGLRVPLSGWGPPTPQRPASSR